MSGLIKRVAADDVTIPLPRPRTLVEPDAPADDPRLAEYQATIARLEADIAKQRRDAEQAIAAARQEGSADAVADDTARTDAVEKGVAEALAAWRDRLAGLDHLAAALARSALAKVFGDDADRADQIARTIAHHVARLGNQAVVRVRVSPADFGDAQLAAPAPGTTISADPALTAGQCRIDLRLGTIDADPTLQWATLDRALCALETAG